MTANVSRVYNSIDRLLTLVFNLIRNFIRNKSEMSMSMRDEFFILFQNSISLNSICFVFGSIVFVSELFLFLLLFRTFNTEFHRIQMKQK